MKAILLYFLLSFFIGEVIAQNLVRNPSLEVLKEGIEGFKGVSGTPDIASKEGKVFQYEPYFNAYQSGSPTRQITSIEFGDVCFCLWFSSGSSELMQAELIRPLKKNREYVISLYTIRASVEEPPIREITVYFTKKPMPFTIRVYGQEDHKLTGENISYLSLTSATSPTLASRESWIKVTGIYKAKGGERYLTIGNFLGANKAELDALNPDSVEITRRNKIKGTYYCYDNISVVPRSEADMAPVPDVAEPMPLNTPIANGKPVTLEDVNFTSGEYRVSEVAFSTLDSLAAFMKAEPEVVLAIKGHTDDVGSEEDNLRLSVQRAQAVKEYLVQKGIAAERLTSQGYGEAMPKVENLTDEHRALNRRVAFEILR